MRLCVATLITVILATACTVSVDDPQQTTATSQPVADVSTTQQTAAPILPDDGSEPPCLQGDRPFSTAGVISAFGSAGGDAAQISGIRTGLDVACERIVVDLLTSNGAPAGSLGLVGVDYNETVGVVRIKLPPAVTRTAIADIRFDGELADRAFVVETLAGELALDIHVVPGVAVALRAFEVASPSRIVVDLRPDPDSETTVGAAFAPDVVVVDPPQDAGGVPLVVTGYARTKSPLIELRIHESRDADPVAIESAVIAQSAEAWSEFEGIFHDPPRGAAELHVGPDQTGLWMSVDNGPLQILGGEDA